MIIINFIIFPSSGLFFSMTHEEKIDSDRRSIYVGNVSCLRSLDLLCQVVTAISRTDFNFMFGIVFKSCTSGFIYL